MITYYRKCNIVIPKKPQNAMICVSTYYYNAIEKTGIWEKETFFAFGDILF